MGSKFIINMLYHSIINAIPTFPLQNHLYKINILVFLLDINSIKKNLWIKFIILSARTYYVSSLVS